MITIRLILLCMVTGLFACSPGPKPIDYGKEECLFCKMTIMDKQYGCQVVNTKGKHFDFDDLTCLTRYLQTGIIHEKDIEAIYVPDYCGSHALFPAEKMFYVSSDLLRSPMAGNVAAFASKDSAMKYNGMLQGREVSWQTIRKAND